MNLMSCKLSDVASEQAVLKQPLFNQGRFRSDPTLLRKIADLRDRMHDEANALFHKFGYLHTTQLIDIPDLVAAGHDNLITRHYGIALADAINNLSVGKASQENFRKLLLDPRLEKMNIWVLLGGFNGFANAELRGWDSYHLPNGASFAQAVADGLVGNRAFGLQVWQRFRTLLAKVTTADLAFDKAKFVIKGEDCSHYPQFFYHIMAPVYYLHTVLNNWNFFSGDSVEVEFARQCEQDRSHLRNHLHDLNSEEMRLVVHRILRRGIYELSGSASSLVQIEDLKLALDHVDAAAAMNLLAQINATEYRGLRGCNLTLDLIREALLKKVESALDLQATACGAKAAV